MNSKIIETSKSLKEYKIVMSRIFKSAYPHMDDRDIEHFIDYSINKRYNNTDIKIYNNYKNSEVEMTLLEISDYIKSREPIITSYGVIFKKHSEYMSPLLKVIDIFMDTRKMYKKEMFKYPKGSEMFEKYNLAQNLSKIDINGIYGLAGLYVSIIFNLHVAPSITSTGRSLISSAIMCFEMFLSNNVKHSCLNDILTFIDNVRMESNKWKYDDNSILDKDKFVSKEECFYKIISTCDFSYIPSDSDMDIVWRIIRNCNAIELNRLYYKNNLYNFMDNSYMQNILISILSTLKTPYMDPNNPPEEIKDLLDQFTDILTEYVYYGYQIIDRMERNKNMIKNISFISDTDSSFVSLDAWYHYCLDIVKGYDFKITHQRLDLIKTCEKINKEQNLKVNLEDIEFNVIEDIEIDSWGDPVDNSINNVIEFEDPVLDYDFYNQDIIEKERSINVLEVIPQDGLKFSIINIMCYVLGKIINDYMLSFTKNSHSYRGDDACRIMMKNEFYMYRILLEDVKKHYVSLQGLQEGNYLGRDKVVDVKGIDGLLKSTIPETVRNELNKIMLEEILTTPELNSLNIIKRLAILEQQIYNDVLDGSKKFYKPLTVKSVNYYKDPLSQQGIKSSIAWNILKNDEETYLDLNERNSIDIIKVDINIKNIDKIRDRFPDTYDKMKRILDISGNEYIGDLSIRDIFKGRVGSVAIPKDVKVPEWIIPFINIQSIISDNISTFPTGNLISKMDNRTGITYTNMVRI